MEINKYYIVKKVYIYFDILVTVYARGYGNWSSDIARAKRYTQLDSVKRLIKNLQKEEPSSKTEILYVTEHIETVDDIIEKDILQS